MGSFFGYNSDQCQVWLETKMSQLENKRDGAGKFGKIFQAIIDKYSQCQVEWLQPNAPIIDVGPPRTVSDQGNVDESYSNTNEKIVDAEDSYNTNEKIVDAEDSYNTNEKIVEDVVKVTDEYSNDKPVVDASQPKY